jgi:isopentenyl phosphate kinase
VDGQLVSLAIEPIRAAIEHGLVPLIYGDVAFDERQGCTITSTEELFLYVAQQVPVHSIVMVGEVDGVYDRDPLADPRAVRIPQITPASFARLQAQLSGSHAVDVTGGMLTKVVAMVSLVASGRVERVHLISGRREGALTQVLLGERDCGGTVIERGCAEQERN